MGKLIDMFLKFLKWGSVPNPSKPLEGQYYPYKTPKPEPDTCQISLAEEPDGFLVIDFKTPQLIAEFCELLKKNKKLYGIIEDVAAYTQEHFNKVIVLTSIFRKPEEQKSLTDKTSGVHCVWRGVDIRSSTFTSTEIAQISSYVNSKYKYDPSRPELLVCLYHTVAGNVSHFHFQNHPNTKVVS